MSRAWSVCPVRVAISVTLLAFLLCLCSRVGTGQAVENSNASNLAVPRFYTFVASDSHILLTANETVARRLTASKREISFDFRTRYSNVLILYETFRVHPSARRIFTLLLALLNGRFQVVLQYGNKQEELFIGYSFNRDLLHRVHLYINPELGFLNIRLNATENTKYYKSLYFNWTLPSALNAGFVGDQLHPIYRLSLGGLANANQTAYYQLNGYRSFVGCIGNLNVVSRSNESNFGILSLAHFSLQRVLEGCQDQCAQLNLCSRRSRCINYYDSKDCDCFGSELEDWHCRSFNYTVLTLRGFSSISYQIYEHLSKAYTDEYLVSLHLRTQHDSILFAALSESLQSYLILNIKNGFLNVLLNLNQNPKNYIFNDFPLDDNQWHNLTLVQRHSKISIFFDVDTVHEIILDEADPYFYFDPEIHIGGFASNVNISRLNLPVYLPNKMFVGCLKHVYFNNINILYSLDRRHKEAKYHGLFDIELGCKPIYSVPITVQPNSYFLIPITNRSSILELEFELKSEQFNAIVANGTFEVTGDNGKRSWHLLMRDQDVKLFIENEQEESHSELGWTLSNDNSLNVSLWNRVRIEVNGYEGFFQMSINEITVQGRYDYAVHSFYGHVHIGSVDSAHPFVGCFRNVQLGSDRIEPRTLNEFDLVVGSVTLDDCQLINPCNQPNVCEHGAVCVPVPENGTYWCDCSSTGYIGKTCHFSVYRKSCEEIYLMDKRHSGIFIIDIDRNGPLPPAHVRCALVHGQNGSVSFRTMVEHNIQHQVIVREKGKGGSFFMDVVYRDFSVEMLRRLVQRSASCQQYVKYECNDIPFSLSTHTLLYSAMPDYKVARIDGSVAKGCQCAGPPNKCVDHNKNCNCDSLVPGWKHDEGYLTSVDEVAITKMYFLQFPNVTHDSEAHLYLGNLSCIDINTQRYEITFKTKQSYLGAPSWNGREMGISFRTTASKAVIFYQSHLDSKSTYFKAVIISENEVKFEYSLNHRKTTVTLSSSHCLNCGQWQHIWIERNNNQMRVSINQNSRIMYLPKYENFIHFDGKLFVGGAPLDYLKGLKINLGFIGCLRGLVFDSEVINLHKYLDPYRKPNIEAGCRPYCRPNLCHNQGHCVEKWGSYECRCANPIAHSGTNCEVNINENSLTFMKPSSIRQVISSNRQIRSILQQDIVLSFRTHAKFALLLFAHDTVNNFVQLHIENGTNVVFTFNYIRRIARREIFLGTPLASGQTVQVKIDHSKNSTLFIVNQKTEHIPYPRDLIKETATTKPWREGHEFQLIKPNTSVASVWSQHEVFIGGVQVPETISAIPPFVGCIQGLMMGGKLIDLIQIGNQTNGTDLADRVKSGCSMLCDQLPCKNGGICTEDWEFAKTRCDCSHTSYRGQLCEIDIGAHFEKDSSVLYTLDNEAILDFTNVDISFAFSSTHLENCTLFLLRYANSSRYLHIGLLADGRLVVEEDNGHDIYVTIIESEEETFLDSHRHWLHYVRKERSAQLIVDSIIYYVSGSNYQETLTSIAQFTENIIEIGSNRFNGEGLANFASFKGCISNINIVLDDFKIDPFESAFGMRSGLSEVKVFGDIQQGICATFHTHRASLSLPIDHQPALPVNPNEIWLRRPKPVLVRLNRTSSFNKSAASYIRKDILFPVCVVILLSALVFVSIYMWRVDRRYKLIKFQGETPFFHKKTNFKRKSFAL